MRAVLLILGIAGISALAGTSITPDQVEAYPNDSQVPPRLGALECFERAARIEYRREEVDRWQSPGETVERGAGDCEDKALYLQDLLAKQDIDSQVVFGVEDARKSMTLHAWVECQIDGQSYVLDPTAGFLARRTSIPGGQHMPVLGLPGVLRKLQAYRQRTGRSGINRYYEYVLDRQENPQLADSHSK